MQPDIGRSSSGRHLTPGIVAVSVIVAAALFASSNGFRFTDLPFPADVLSAAPPWQATGAATADIKNPLLRDPVAEFHPWQQLMRSAMREGRWPLWNPYAFMGVPLLGNGQISTFTPFYVPLLFLPPVPAYLLMTFLKICVAGLSMYFFARARNIGVVAGLVAGLTFMFSGHMMAWLHFPLSGGLALAPLVLLAGEKCLQTASRLWFTVLVIGVAWLTLCGQPQTAFCVMALLGAFLIYRLSARPVGAAAPGRRRLAALRIFPAVLLGIGLSGFQSLPFLEYLQESAADNVRNAYNVFYLPVYQLVTLLLPDFFGNVVHGNYWGYANNIGPACYCGVLPLMLALTAAILSRRDPDSLFFAGTSLVCLLVLTKPPGMEQLLQAPVLAGITVNKFIGPFTLGVAFLAAKGIDLFWLKARTVLSVCALWFALFCVGIVGAALYFRKWLAALDLAHYELVRGIPFFAVTPLVLLMLWILHRRTAAATPGALAAGRFPVGASAVLLVAAAGFDPLYCWLNFNPSVDRRHLFPGTGGIEQLKRAPGITRVMGLEGALFPNTAGVFGLQDALGYDGMTYWRYYDFMEMLDPDFKDLWKELHLESIASKPWDPRTSLFDDYLRGLLRRKGAGFEPYLKKANYWNTVPRRFQARRLLDLMNVKHLVAPPGWSAAEILPDLDLVYDKEIRIYANKTVLPRAFLVHHWVYAKSDEAARQMMLDPRYDPATTAILQDPAAGKEIAGSASGGAGPGARPDSVEILSYSGERLALQVETADAAVLLLLDTWYPGWRCRIDGREVPVLIADYLFRGVPLSPGKHEIVFSYEPAYFYWGLRLSGLSALAALLMLFWIGRPSRPGELIIKAK